MLGVDVWKTSNLREGLVYKAATKWGTLHHKWLGVIGPHLWHHVHWWLKLHHLVGVRMVVRLVEVSQLLLRLHDY
jgi:hypothetical protein